MSGLLDKIKNGLNSAGSTIKNVATNAAIAAKNWVLIKIRKVVKIFLGAGFFFFFAFGIMFLVEGSDNKKFGMCYSGAEFGRKVRCSLNIKDIQGYGPSVYPHDYATQAQIPTWQDCGVETNGEPLEIFAKGLWYPWGKEETDKVTQTISSSDGSTKINTTELVCDMSEDISSTGLCEHGFDKDGNCRYLESDEFRLSNINRYTYVSKSSKIPLSEQNAYIYGYHIESRESNVAKSLSYDEIYQKLTNAKTYDGSSACAMDNGAGVYMRIGEESPISYHIINKKVDKITADETSQTGWRISLTENKTRDTITLPFTLPTTKYDPNRMLDKGDNYQTQFTAPLRPLNVNDKEYKEMQFFGNCDPYKTLPNKPKDASDSQDPNACEFTYPAPGQTLYFTVSDTVYDGNDGTVVLDFTRGARYKGLSDKGLLSFVYDRVFKGVFGINIYDGTLEKKGMIREIRDAILGNVMFRATTYMILIYHIVQYASALLRQEQAISISIIVEKFTYFGFAIWAMNPGNYDMIDEFILPLIVGALNDLGGAVINGILETRGLSGNVINTSNPAASFDGLINDLFGEVILAKLLALYAKPGIYMFMPSIILCAIIAVLIYVFRAVSISMLCVFTIAVDLTIFFIAVAGLFFNEKYTDKIKEITKTIFDQTIASIAGLTVFTVMLVPIMMSLKDLLSFNICFQELMSIGDITFSGWRITSEITATDIISKMVLLMIFVYMGVRMHEFAYKFSSTIFGTTKDMSFAKDVFNKAWDGTIGNASKVISPFTEKYLGLKTSVTSKDLEDPTSLVTRGIGFSARMGEHAYNAGAAGLDGLAGLYKRVRYGKPKPIPKPKPPAPPPPPPPTSQPQPPPPPPPPPNHRKDDPDNPPPGPNHFGPAQPVQTREIPTGTLVLSNNKTEPEVQKVGEIPTDTLVLSETAAESSVTPPQPEPQPVPEPFVPHPHVELSEDDQRTIVTITKFPEPPPQPEPQPVPPPPPQPDIYALRPDLFLEDQIEDEEEDLDEDIEPIVIPRARQAPPKPKYTPPPRQQIENARSFDALIIHYVRNEGKGTKDVKQQRTLRKKAIDDALKTTDIAKLEVLQGSKYWEEAKVRYETLLSSGEIRPIPQTSQPIGQAQAPGIGQAQNSAGIGQAQNSAGVGQSQASQPIGQAQQPANQNDELKRQAEELNVRFEQNNNRLEERRRKNKNSISEYETKLVQLKSLLDGQTLTEANIEKVNAQIEQVDKTLSILKTRTDGIDAKIAKNKTKWEANKKAIQDAQNG